MLRFSAVVFLGLVCVLLEIVRNSALLQHASLHSLQKANNRFRVESKPMGNARITYPGKKVFALCSKTMEKSSAEYVHSLFGLDGKVAIVSGSTGGLGYSMAKTLLQCGAHVVINGRSKDRITAAQESMYAETGKTTGLLGVRGDMSVVEDAKALVEQTVAAFGQVDIIVNNGGINLKERPFEESTIADWHQIAAANTDGPINLTNAALPYLKKSPAGRIICMASIGAHTGLVNNTLYCMTKGAMLLFTKSLASELGNTNIRVNSISPGIFATPMNAKFVDDASKKAEVVKQVPIGRMGEPYELGGVVAFLASAASSYTHGADFAVDGGFLHA